MVSASSLEDRVKAEDPDRALCAQFLPRGVREDVFTLLAFHNEVTRALAPARSSAVVGPMAGYVRLQWWRDVLEGTRAPEHEIAPLMLAALERGVFQYSTVLGILDARETELAPEQDAAHWSGMMLKGSGGLQRAVGEALAVQDPTLFDQLSACGAAYGAGAMLRHWPVLQKSGRYIFPGSPEGLQKIAKTWLEQSDNKQSVPRPYQVALLPAVLARRDIGRGSQSAGMARGIMDRLAVMAAGLKA